MPLSSVSPRKALALKVGLVGAVVSILTVLKTYPLISHIGTHLPGDSGDPVLVTWILSWGAHALTTDPWGLFNANIFYPAQNTLALSEHMIGAAPIFGPPYLITGNPILAYNTAFLLSFILCGMFMFLLVYHWTGSFWASLLSGCFFAFAPIRFTELSHLQLNNFYWAPLVFLFLDRFLQSKRWTDLAYFAVFYWLQVLCSVYLGWLITIGASVYIVYWVIFRDRSFLTRVMVTRYAAFIISSLIIFLPFHLPYYRIQQRWGISTLLQDCIYWSADPFINYLSPPHLFNDVYLSLVRNLAPSIAYPRNDMLLFPGFVVSILASVGMVSMVGLTDCHRAQQLKRLFVVIGLSSLLLSLGPSFTVLGFNTGIPLPYQLFYHMAPGFQAMRVPARFAIMTVLAASVLAGLGFLKSCQVLKGRWRVAQASAFAPECLLALFWLCLFIAELGFKPLPLVKMATADQVPEVYRWLSTKELDGPILELPLDQSEALKYMYYSTYHWLPLLNGASGYAPTSYAQLRAELTDLPSPQAIELLGALGVKAVILHTDQLDPREIAQWEHAKLADLGIEEASQFGPDVVYKLRPVETTPYLHIELAIPEPLPGGEMVKLPQKGGLGFRLSGETLSDHFWTHPQPLGKTEAVVEWEALHTSKILTQRERLEFPVAIKPDDAWWTTLALRAPAVPGQYALRVLLPVFNFKTAPKLVEVTPNRYPESALTPQLLSASYALEGTTPQGLLSKDVHITVQVMNTGKALWLARVEDDRGAIRLGWQWFKGEERVPFREGREWLRYDVFPGQIYRFEPRIDAPSEPGDYRLEVGLVSELVTWFSDLGVRPLTFNVEVRTNLEVRVQTQATSLAP